MNDTLDYATPRPRRGGLKTWILILGILAAIVVSAGLLWSKETDRPGAPDHSGRFKAVSGPGLILYGFTISFAAIDWIMSLDPSWISTIFGLVILIGEVLSAMCFAIVVEHGVPGGAGDSLGELVRPQDHRVEELLFLGFDVHQSGNRRHDDDDHRDRKHQLSPESSRHKRYISLK